MRAALDQGRPYHLGLGEFPQDSAVLAGIRASYVAARLRLFGWDAQVDRSDGVDVIIRAAPAPDPAGVTVEDNE